MHTQGHKGWWLISNNPDSPENMGNDSLKNWKAVNKSGRKLGKYHVKNFVRVIHGRFVMVIATRVS